MGRAFGRRAAPEDLSRCFLIDGRSSLLADTIARLAPVDRARADSLRAGLGGPASDLPQGAPRRPGPACESNRRTERPRHRGRDCLRICDDRASRRRRRGRRDASRTITSPRLAAFRRTLGRRDRACRHTPRGGRNRHRPRIAPSPATATSRSGGRGGARLRSRALYREAAARGGAPDGGVGKAFCGTPGCS